MQELSLSGRTVLMRIMLRAAELLWVNLSLPIETATASNIHFSVHETFQCHLMASHAQSCVPCTCHRSWVRWLRLDWLHHSSVSLHKGDFLMCFFSQTIMVCSYFSSSSKAITESSLQLHLHQCRVRAVLWLRRAKQLWCNVPHCDPALWVLRNAQTDR